MGNWRSRDETMAHHEGYVEGGPSNRFFGSSYRSGYPFHRRDYDVHKKIWDPYINRPSIAQRIFEFLCILIICTAIPVFLGGVLQVFVMFFCLFLGILGLFAWPRRHMLYWLIFAVGCFALLIVSIILRSQQVAACFPFVYQRSPQLYTEDVVGTSPVTVQPYLINTNWHSNYCGNDILTYITHGLLLAWIVLAFPFAIKIACERRRRFYDYDYVQGAVPGAGPVGIPTSGHTAVYNRPATTAVTTGSTVTATPVVATYAATPTGAVIPPVH